MDTGVEESIPDLQRVGDLATQFLGKGGSLESTKYAEFFIPTPKVASFSAILLTKLLHILTGEEKHVQLGDAIKRLAQNNPGVVPELQKLPDIDPELYLVQQSIITTGYFMAAFYPFNPTFAPLKSIVGRLFTFRQKTRTIAPTTPDYLFIGELERLLSAKDYTTTPEGLKFLIQQACSIDYPEDLDITRASARIMAPSFIQSVLRNRLPDPVKAKEIFETILDFLRHPSTSEEMILGLLHMLRTFLLHTPMPPVGLYSAIQQRVAQFYLWPRPWADCARDVLELVSLDLKAPGAAFRSRFVEEISGLRVPPPPGSNLPEEPPLTGKERVVSLIIDRDIVGAKLLYEVLKNTVPPQIPVPELQYRLLYCCFVTCLNIQPDQLGIEYLKKDDIGRFYTQAMQIMEQSLVMEEAAANHYRLIHLSTVKDQIMQAVTSAQSFPLPKPPKVPALDLHIKFANFSDSSQARDPTSRHNYPKRECTDTLTAILTDYLVTAPPDQRPLVKICIVGGDLTIHNLIVAVVSLRQSRPEFFDKLDVRFYYIPPVASELANFIGSQDKWYGRQVVCLVRAIQALHPQLQIPTGQPQDAIIVPSAPTSSGNLADRVRSMSLGLTGLSALGGNTDFISEHEKLVNPSTVLRGEFENYFREAKWPLTINVYKCECWTNDNQIVCIPFFSRAQLGLPAYIEAFRKANDLPLTLSQQEVMGSRNFKFSPPSCRIKFTQMNVLNVARGGQNDDTPRAFTHIAVASIPVPGDKQNCVHAHPSRAWLELMLAEDPRSSKSKNKTPEPRTYHVSQIDIAGDKCQLDLLLDGRHYGPFARVRISAIVHLSGGASAAQSDNIMNLPIMTFMPIGFND